MFHRIRATAPFLAALCLALPAIPVCGQDLQAPASSSPPTKEDFEVNWLYGAYVSKDQPLHSLNGEQRFDLYMKQTFTGFGSYAKTGFFSITDQIIDSPPDWDQDLGGFGQRAASRHGQFVIQNTFSALGNAALGYEPRYDRCRCSGFWSRTKHAVVRNFVTYDKSESKKRPQFAMYGAALAAGAISSNWKPNADAWDEGYRSVFTQVGFGTLANLLSEFAPEVMRVIRKPKEASPPSK
jgi:hypothetical protein